MENGASAELQIVPREIYEYSKAIGHADYKKVRTGTLPEAVHQELEQRTKQGYGEAFERWMERAGGEAVELLPAGAGGRKRKAPVKRGLAEVRRRLLARYKEWQEFLDSDVLGLEGATASTARVVKHCYDERKQLNATQCDKLRKSRRSDSNR